MQTTLGLGSRAASVSSRVLPMKLVPPRMSTFGLYVMAKYQ